MILVYKNKMGLQKQHWEMKQLNCCKEMNFESIIILILAVHEREKAVETAFNH